MVAEPASGVWRGKWAEVTASFNSEDEVDDGNCEESAALYQAAEGNGHEIRRSARPRRIAAKAAEADFSSISGEEDDDDERPLKRRTSLSASATPSRGRHEPRRLSDSQTRIHPSKLDEKRMRKRETNKNSARKMRLQRKEELNSLLHERNDLQDKLNLKTKDLRGSQAMLHSLENTFAALDGNYKVLAQSHTLLVVELVKQLTCLRGFVGKKLEQSNFTHIVAQIAQRLPPEEEALLLADSDQGLTKAELSSMEISPNLLGGMGEAADDTVLIQVTPRPGTQVQIFRPKAVRALSSDAASCDASRLPAQLIASGVSSAPFQQHGLHSPPILGISSPKDKEKQQSDYAAKLTLTATPQTPSTHGPTKRVSPGLAEGTAFHQASRAISNGNVIETPRPQATEHKDTPENGSVKEQLNLAHPEGHIAAHQVIRPQARPAIGAGSETSVAMSLPLQDRKSVNQAVSPDKHLSDFQPVLRTV